MIKKISIVLSRTLKLYSDKSDFTFSSFCKMTVIKKNNVHCISKTGIQKNGKQLTK